MRGLQAALTRKPYDGCGDERLPLHDILHAYTAGGAWAAHMDHVSGKLVPGLAADIVVLDGDIEEPPPPTRSPELAWPLPSVAAASRMMPS